jgi:hypothetical protein
MMKSPSTMARYTGMARASLGQRASASRNTMAVANMIKGTQEK